MMHKNKGEYSLALEVGVGIAIMTSGRGHDKWHFVGVVLTIENLWVWPCLDVMVTIHLVIVSIWLHV